MGRTRGDLGWGTKVNVTLLPPQGGDCLGGNRCLFHPSWRKHGLPAFKGGVGGLASSWGSRVPRSLRSSVEVGSESQDGGLQEHGGTGWGLSLVVQTPASHLRLIPSSAPTPDSSFLVTWTVRSSGDGLSDCTTREMVHVGDLDSIPSS